MKRNLLFAAAVLVFAVSGAAWYVTSHDRAGAMARNTPNAASLQELAKGPMANFTLISDDKTAPDLPFVDGNGKKRKLSDFRGKILLVNFWATWCAPCRKEMPTLDQLQAEMGDKLAVVPVATLRNSVAGVQKFFADQVVTHLPVRMDPDAQLARAIGVMGLPVTLIMNPEGKEVARLIGEADWNSDSAKAILTAMMAGG